MNKINQKILLIMSLTGLSVMSHSVWAAEPEFKFGVIDVSKAVQTFRPAAEHEFSKENLNERFCWQISNLPANRRMITVEATLTAPSATTFLDQQGRRISSTTHREFVDLEVLEGTVLNCGQFEASDPSGQYILTIRADGKKYPSQKIILK